jgi:hypothetical protein
VHKVGSRTPTLGLVFDAVFFLPQRLAISGLALGLVDDTHHGSAFATENALAALG